jgi:hypothetical protein
MNTTQYTIRSIPKNLDEFLRKQARKSNKSLNTIIIEYLQQSTKLDLADENDDFAWIIGANTMDDAVTDAIAELKQADKAKKK